MGVSRCSMTRNPAATGGMPEHADSHAGDQRKKEKGPRQNLWVPFLPLGAITPCDFNAFRRDLGLRVLVLISPLAGLDAKTAVETAENAPSLAPARIFRRPTATATAGKRPPPSEKHHQIL